jgi:hypothetical protein
MSSGEEPLRRLLPLRYGVRRRTVISRDFREADARTRTGEPLPYECRRMRRHPKLAEGGVAHLHAFGRDRFAGYLGAMLPRVAPSY